MDRIFIKNMVCNRCIMVVQNELEKLGLPVKQVELGEVELERKLSAGEKENITVCVFVQKKPKKLSLR